ncbi:hypothetical protein [Nocardiopsis salina]|nr:hypothetical protein [Nocardiopsis salina]
MSHFGSRRPEICTEFFRRKRPACVKTDLASTDTELLRTLLTEAREHEKR